MIEGMKESWQRFKASKPGHRFQDRYRRRQESEHGWRDPRRLFCVVGGLIIAVGSLLLGVFPGALAFFLGRMAGEFRPVAHLLDSDIKGSEGRQDKFPVGNVVPSQ